MSTFEIVMGSCAEQEVDAIVNAANRNLWSGGGICGVIFKKAGYKELTDACSKVKTPLNDGEAVITSAFNIENAKYIIHAIGPDFNLTPDAYDKLYNAYYNSLKILRDNQLHSISFPLISSGIFAWNIEKPALNSAKECLKAYNKFLNDHRDYDINVKICAFSTKEMEELKEIM